MRFRRSAAGLREDADYDLLTLQSGGFLRGSRDPVNDHTRLRAEVGRYSSSLVFTLWAALARFVDAIDAELAPFKLTMERLNVLRELATARAPLHMTALARRMALSRSTMSGLVKRLEADGFVRQLIIEHDLRNRTVVGRTDGYFAAAAASSALELVCDRLTRSLSSDQMSALRSALTTLADPRDDLRAMSTRSRSAQLRCAAAETLHDASTSCTTQAELDWCSQSGSRLCRVVGISSLTVGCACTAREMTV